MPARSTRKFPIRLRTPGIAALLAALPAAACWFCTSVSTAATLPKVTPAPIEELLLMVTVNAQTAGEAEVVLRSADGRWWLSEDSVRRWRLLGPAARARGFGNTRYYPLDALPRTVVAFHPADESLTITASPEAFALTTLPSESTPLTTPTRPPPGGFLNYELFASHADGADALAGNFEAGWFTPRGVFVTSALAQHAEATRDVLRLESTWTSDFPAQLATLRLGDAIGVPGAWGRAVRFGGVQYATNFGTRPGFVTFPEISANGQAALPSTVDVFVNNALVAQRSVPPGPFSIPHVPTTTGGGQVELVVHDLFGREQIITQRFYANADLLAPGLSQFAYEAGFERRNFGIESNDYGPAFASGTYRRGITPGLTLEARGEASRDQVTGGGAATWLWRSLGTFSAALAVSTGRGGDGSLASVAFNREVERFSFTAATQWTSNAFRQLGDDPDTPIPKMQTSTAIGYQFGALGSANVTYIRQAYRTKPGVELASLGYTVSIARKAVLSLAATRLFGGDGSRAITVTVSIPWGARNIASAGYDHTRSDGREADAATLTVQRNLPAGEGFGYRLYARSPDIVQAGAAYQSDAGLYTLEAARADGHDGVRASVAGAIGVVDGYAFVARAITESFGVVRIDDYPDVHVLVDNQVVGQTGANGLAVIPRLHAYDANRVSIDQRDLPLDATVDALSMEAVPYFRTGILFDFPVRRSHGASLRVKLDDGGDLPAGAYAEIDQNAERFPVGMNGELYVTGLKPWNRLRVTWRGQHCDIEVAMPATHEPLPHLGTYACRGVAR